MAKCESASQCGLVDKHPDEKKELLEIGKKKQKLESELKSLSFDIQNKERATMQVATSFEAKVHDVLIRSNPEKYLTEHSRPKEGIVLSDSYILKKYYGTRGGTITKEELENECSMFAVIIESYNDKMKTEKIKSNNSVLKELEMSTGQFTATPWMRFNPFVPMFDGGFGYMSPIASPPLPVPNPPPPVATPPPPPDDERL